MSRPFRFRSVWRLSAAPPLCWDEIVAALVPGTVSWWRGVRIVSAPPVPGPGETVVLEVRAPWGYRLRTRLVLERVVVGRELTASSRGDLDGRGMLTLAATEGGCEAEFRWEVAVRRRWMRATAWLLRPAFVIGHRVIMRRGERALRRRLQRLG